jgi:hypothetical protein
MMIRILCSLSMLLLWPALAQAQLEIVRATYGAGGLQENVTARVRAYVQNNGLYLQVNPETMGGDPAPGTQKTLFVEYREGWRYRTARAVDFQAIRIGNTTGLTMATKAPAVAAPAAPAATVPAAVAAASDLRIVRATYGERYRRNDVTQRLNSWIRQGRLEIMVTNANMGGDPAPSEKKDLQVTYAMGGREHTVTMAEGETLRLPAGNETAAPGSGAAAGLEIRSARYGAGTSVADVTEALRRQVQNGRLEVTVNGQSLGGDPAPGTVKMLRVDYVLDGKEMTTYFRDGDLVKLAAANAGSAPAAPAVAAIAQDHGGWKILGATYVASGMSRDVTDVLRRKVDSGRLAVFVAGFNLGVDAAGGTLQVEYEVNGERRSIAAAEGETLRLPVNELKIVAALYGAPGRQVDVKTAVERQIVDGTAMFVVNGETLGGDPAPGVVKTLNVTYEVDGKRKMASARDGETFRTEREAAVETAAGQMISNGVCFYRWLDFHGQPWCVRTGQDVRSVGDGFLSMRTSGGNRTVEIYEQANFQGRKMVLTADERDLMATGAWWRYEPAARIGSVRVR